MALTLKGYKKILSQVQKTIQETEQNIVQNVNRQKVEMCWKLGKIIDEHLLENNRADYGKKFFHELSADISIAEKTLYQMRSFYKTYPTLPKDNAALSWSHYRNLVSVKNDETRKYLEDLTVTKNLDTKTLQSKISKSKARTKSSKKASGKKLKFERGKLFTYTLNKTGEADLGFNVFFSSPQSSSLAHGAEDLRSLTLRDPRRSASRMTAAGGMTAVTMTAVTKSDYTYKAELERIVDGDTIHVKLDLGFGIKHREILRLAKINAAESVTASGLRATAALKKILKDSPFLIVRTNKTDIYGRYIADVFFGKKNEKNPQKVADSGIYLNQLLLDLGLVDLY